MTEDDQGLLGPVVEKEVSPEGVSLLGRKTDGPALPAGMQLGEIGVVIAAAFKSGLKGDPIGPHANQDENQEQQKKRGWN